MEQDSGDSDNQLERVVDSSDEESNLKPPKTMKKKHRSFSRFVLPPPAERPCYDLGPDTGFPGTVLLFSGAYDLVGLLPFLHERGLYHSSMKRVSGYNLKGSSPLYVVDRMSPAVGDLLPVRYFFSSHVFTIGQIVGLIVVASLCDIVLKLDCNLHDSFNTFNDNCSYAFFSLNRLQLFFRRSPYDQFISWCVHA